MESYFEDPELQKVLQSNQGVSQNVFNPDSLMTSAFGFGKQAAENKEVELKDLKDSAQQFTDKPISEKDLQSKGVQEATKRFTEAKEQEIASGRKTAADLYEEAKQKQNISIGEALSLGALALVPSLVGFAVGGNRGGYEGAKVGGSASGAYFDSLIKERENVRGLTAEQAAAAEARAKSASDQVGKAELKGFDKELDLLAPNASGKEMRLRLRIPDRQGRPQSEVIEAIRGADGRVTYLDGTEIPQEIISQAQAGFRERPRVDPESGFIVVQDPFAPNGVRTMRRASKYELSSGLVDEFGAVQARPPAQIAAPVSGTQPQASEQESVQEAPKFQLKELPSANVNFADYDVSEHPRVKQIAERRAALENQLTTTLQPGESVKQRDSRIKNTERQINDLLKDEDRQENQLTKALEKAIDGQAVARSTNRIVSRIAGIKDGVDTGFITDTIGPVLDKFDSLGEQERIALRSRVEEALSAFLVERSGAAVAEPEFQRLARVVPGMGDDDEAFKTKLKEFAVTAENLRRKTMEGSGLFQFGGSEINPEALDDRRQRARQILEQRRKARGE